MPSTKYTREYLACPNCGAQNSEIRCGYNSNSTKQNSKAAQAGIPPMELGLRLRGRICLDCGDRWDTIEVALSEAQSLLRPFEVPVPVKPGRPIFPQIPQRVISELQASSDLLSGAMWKLMEINEEEDGK